MLHRSRVVPLLSLRRCENRPAASQPSSSAKMHWNTHLGTFPPSFGLPWGRVMGITAMFAPEYVSLFWEKCGLFCARGVNAEKIFKNEEAIQSDATARQPDCWQVSSMILNTIILQRDEVVLLFIYRKEWETIRRCTYQFTYTFSHSNFHCFFIYLCLFKHTNAVWAITTANSVILIAQCILK